MIKDIQMPSKREVLTVTVIMTLSLLLTSIFIGLRSKHLLMAVFYLVLSLAGLPTCKLAVALLPFAIFGILCDRMHICPNCEVNLTGTAEPYNLEKSFFGVMGNGLLVVPCGYFAAHSWPIANIFAGIFYPCWVLVPIPFGPCLYFKKERKTYLRFALAFLLVNLIGFAGHHIHPAAPSWYAINYGFEPILNTPGNVAGLECFDTFFGVTVFDSVYRHSADVLAAVSSLHAAYTVVVLVYTITGKRRWHVVTLFSIIMVGTWGTAIYSYHHYITDASLDISRALTGRLILEYISMRIPTFKRFSERHCTYIK